MRKRKILAVDDTAAKIILEDWFKKIMRQKINTDI
jgi:RNase H-fold protein (predicted Holliday junction resolvase)